MSVTTPNPLACLHRNSTRTAALALLFSGSVSIIALAATPALAACAPNVTICVTKSTDNGDANDVGSYSWAIDQANQTRDAVIGFDPETFTESNRTLKLQGTPPVTSGGTKRAGVVLRRPATIDGTATPGLNIIGNTLGSERNASSADQRQALQIEPDGTEEGPMRVTIRNIEHITGVARGGSGGANSQNNTPHDGSGIGGGGSGGAGGMGSGGAVHSGSNVDLVLENVGAIGSAHPGRGLSGNTRLDGGGGAGGSINGGDGAYAPSSRITQDGGRGGRGLVGEAPNNNGNLNGGDGAGMGAGGGGGGVRGGQLGRGGDGGFGGGAGGGIDNQGATGTPGFGGGFANGSYGGEGMVAGGVYFIANNSTLTLRGNGTVNAGQLVGTGGLANRPTRGLALANGIYLQGNAGLRVEVDEGETQLINGDIGSDAYADPDGRYGPDPRDPAGDGIDSGVIYRGSGTAIVRGNNTYIGETIVDGATLNIADERSLGHETSRLTMQDATLAAFIRGDFPTQTMLRHVEIQRDINLLGETATFDVQRNGAMILSGDLLGDVSLVKTGQGSLDLAGQNGTGGDFHIQNGLVSLLDGGTIENNHMIVDGHLDISTAHMSVADRKAQLDQLSAQSDITVRHSQEEQALIQKQDAEMRQEVADGRYPDHIRTSPGSIQSLMWRANSANADKVHFLDEQIARRAAESAALGQAHRAERAVETNTLAQLSQAVSGTSRDVSTRTLVGGGTSLVTLGDHNLIISQAEGDFAGTITGNGGVTIADGIQTLSGSNDYRGATQIHDTLIAGAENSLSANSTHIVHQEATLLLGDANQSIGALDNSGLVVFGATPGVTLSIAGDYASQNGVVEINSALGDDSSVTDRINVAGSTSGDTLLHVNNVGGTGAPTTQGIRVVEVLGQSDGTFRIEGDYRLRGEEAKIVGAYSYMLRQGGRSTPNDGHWYLRSENPNGDGPLYQPAVPLAEAYPQVLFGALGGVTTLQQRIGNRHWSEDATQHVDGFGPWVRFNTGTSAFLPAESLSGYSFNQNIAAFEAGANGIISSDSNSTLVGELNVYYGRSFADVSSVHGSGSINTEAFGIGAALTWYHESGFYLDATGRVVSTNSKLRSHELGELAADHNGSGYVASLETGYAFKLDENLTVTPQAQITHRGIAFDDISQMLNGTEIARISLQDGARTEARLGVSIDLKDSWTAANGTTSRSHIYGVANLYYDIDGASSVSVAGQDAKSARSPLSAGIGFGGTLNWNNDAHSIYGEVSARSSFENFGSDYDLSAKIGLRVKW